MRQPKTIINPYYADAPFHDGGLARRHHQADRRRSRWSPASSKSGGRNTGTGRISSRFSGGGHKQAYRIIDFKRDKVGIPAKVAAIEYDPNRSRAHRAAALRRRREALHHRSGRAWRSDARCSVGSGGRHPGRQRAAAQEHPGRHRGSQHRIAARQGRARWRVRPARRRSWSPGKATTRC